MIPPPQTLRRGSPCGGGMDCSGSRPQPWVSVQLTKRHPRIPLQSSCGDPPPCSPSNHEDSNGTEHRERLDERGGPDRGSGLLAVTAAPREAGGSTVRT